MRQLPLTGEETSGAEALIPERPSLKTLRETAAGCTACPLYEHATQTVFGEGLKRARLMLVGEQPGDREDIEGHPFVGPAGRVLDDALERAEIERGDAYITNVVKHFKWKPAGQAADTPDPEGGGDQGVRPLAGGRAGGRRSPRSSSAWGRRR